GPAGHFPKNRARFRPQGQDPACRFPYSKGSHDGGFQPGRQRLMLVLTRKLGEMIRIGDQIKVTVLEVRSGQVKLGIDAPTEGKVHREEVYARIQAENRRAGRANPASLRGPAQELRERPLPTDGKKDDPTPA